MRPVQDRQTPRMRSPHAAPWDLQLPTVLDESKTTLHWSVVTRCQKRKAARQSIVLNTLAVRMGWHAFHSFVQTRRLARLTANTSVLCARRSMSEEKNE